MFKFYFLSLKKNIYFINKQNYNKKDYLFYIHLYIKFIIKNINNINIINIFYKIMFIIM